MRTMYDSTTVTDIPTHAEMVAGYTDGRYQTVDQLRRRFRRAQVVTITVLGRGEAHVVDVEPGNVGAGGAASWCAAELAANRRPTVYCSLADWPHVRATVDAACKRAGVKASRVSYWIARWDGSTKIPPGSVAVQYADPTRSGGHYDVSAVADYWPGVDPKPKLPRLRHGKRRTARRLLRELRRRQRQAAAADRPVLRRLLVQIRRLLNVKEQ